MAKKDKLQEAHNKLAVDDIGLRAEVAELKAKVALLEAAVLHPKKPKDDGE